jgi:thiol-disulfide isomerase/thioredoxin
MKAVTYFFVLCALSFATVAADETSNPAGALSSQLSKIQQERKEAEAAYSNAIQSLPNTPEGSKKRDELWNGFDEKQAALFMAAVELAKIDPKSEVGFSALEWILTIPRVYYLPAGIPAIGLVTDHHAANPKVGKIVAWIGYYMPPSDEPAYPGAIALIQSVAERNPNRTARGQAVMALAWEAKRKFSESGDETTLGGDALAVKAEQAFELITRDYADCPRLMQNDQRTLGKEAEQELYGLRNLRVGKVAPDVEGQDLDEVKIKLSDFRGRVTAIVFWATWCGPCMQMVPHERKLVEQMKNQPFVLIGVNGDSDRNQAKQMAATEAMTWRSFWNGPRGKEGPISDAWNVRGWPTVYLLDPKGVIRLKFEGYGGKRTDSLLDGAVTQLVKELDEQK